MSTIFDSQLLQRVGLCLHLVWWFFDVICKTFLNILVVLCGVEYSRLIQFVFFAVICAKLAFCGTFRYAWWLFAVNLSPFFLVGKSVVVSVV